MRGVSKAVVQGSRPAGPCTGRRRTMLAASLSVGFGLLMLSACATSKDKTINVSQAQLEQMVARRFPYSARWLDAIDVTALAPKLSLQPGASTITADIDVEAVNKLFGERYHGNLSVASGLRYEPMDNSFRFMGVKVNRFEVDGLPQAYKPETQRLGALLAEQLLENYPIYTLTPEQQQLLRDTGLKVTAMRITDKGLSITLSPLL